MSVKEFQIKAFANSINKIECRNCPLCGFNCNALCIDDNKEETLTEMYDGWHTLIKMVDEYKVPVLDEIEKNYLTNFLRPFVRKYDIKVKKVLSFSNDQEYLSFSFTKYDIKDFFVFPYFPKNTMYKNMKLERWYTLDELDLKF